MEISNVVYPLYIHEYVVFSLNYYYIKYKYIYVCVYKYMYAFVPGGSITIYVVTCTYTL